MSLTDFIITYIMYALDAIRIRLQDTYGARSKEYKLLKNKKNVSLLRKYSNEIDAEKEIDRWISKCILKSILEFIEAAGTISRWKEYIINSFIDERYSNGYTEGINNKIKVIKRVGFGYKSFELLRGRILYIFGGKISGFN